MSLEYSLEVYTSTNPKINKSQNYSTKVRWWRLGSHSHTTNGLQVQTVPPWASGVPHTSTHGLPSVGQGAWGARPFPLGLCSALAPWVLEVGQPLAATLLAVTLIFSPSLAPKSLPFLNKYNLFLIPHPSHVRVSKGKHREVVEIVTYLESWKHQWQGVARGSRYTGGGGEVEVGTLVLEKWSTTWNKGEGWETKKVCMELGREWWSVMSMGVI